MTLEEIEKVPVWIKDFENDTWHWYQSLMLDLQKGKCLMCGITPSHILNVSKLIPVEISQAHQSGIALGREEGLTHNLIQTNDKFTDSIRSQTIHDAIEVGTNKLQFGEDDEPEIELPDGYSFKEKVAHFRGYNQAISDYQESLKKLIQ